MRQPQSWRVDDEDEQCTRAILAFPTVTTSRRSDQPGALVKDHLAQDNVLSLYSAYALPNLALLSQGPAQAPAGGACPPYGPGRAATPHH